MHLSYDHCLDLAIRGPWGDTPPTTEEITTRAQAYFDAQPGAIIPTLRGISDALGIDIGEIPPGPDVIDVVLSRIAKLQAQAAENEDLRQVRGLQAKLASETRRLIAAETKDMDHLQALYDGNHNAEYYDQRLAEIIDNRHRELRLMDAVKVHYPALDEDEPGTCRKVDAGTQGEDTPTDAWVEAKCEDVDPGIEEPKMGEGVATGQTIYSRTVITLETTRSIN